MLVRIEFFLEVTCDVFAVHGTCPFQPEPVIDALGVKDMQATGEHFDLITGFVLLHADGALRVLLQLFSDLILLRSKNLLEEAQ